MIISEANERPYIMDKITYIARIEHRLAIAEGALRTAVTDADYDYAAHDVAVWKDTLKEWGVDIVERPYEQYAD
jgi:hypothetical protein